MKLKQMFLMLAFLLALPLLAQDATHNNRLYITIGETGNLTKVPLMLHLDNPTIDITAAEAYIALPENALLGNGVLYGRAQNHELVEGDVEGTRFVSIASPSLSVIAKGNEFICTWLCDFSQLADGEHTVTATGMFAVGVDDAGVTSYTVAEQSLTIAIEGNATGVEKVEIRNEKGEMGDEKKEIYDLGGRRVKEITAKGIYIVNGKKTVLK